ncbi:MAG TPA: hypothetical protein VN577_19635 [Terriglobales bacterium]|nr:hypothetical protein [Terriglobales bacterium]
MTAKAKKWVHHPKFGVGLVTDEYDEKYSISFVSFGDKILLKTAVVDGAPPTPNFTFKSSPSRRPSRFKVQKARRKPVPTFDHLVDVFKGYYPGGFDGEKFQRLERDYKFRAVNFVRSELSERKFRKLLRNSDHKGICKLAFKAVNFTNLIYQQEKIKLRDCLKAVEDQEKFSQQLFNVLYGSAEFSLRFESWCALLAELGDCYKWTIATYFSFLESQGDRMFFKPAPTKCIADSLGFALNYKTEPNWFTYSKLMELAKSVEQELRRRGLVPKSGIDIQGFIWASVKIESGV